MAIQTVTEMEQELNRWLRVQWMKADFIHSFPSLESVRDRVQGMLSNILSNTHRADLNIPEDRADVPLNVLAMLTVSVDPKTKVIAVSSIKPGHTMDLIWLKGEVERLELDGESFNAVKSVSSEYALHEKFTEMLSDAIRLASYLPVQQIWASAPKDFKEKNPICPRCCGLLEAMDLNESSVYWNKSPRYHYVCHSCSFESNTASGTKYDLAETYVSNFEKELKRVETADKAKEKAAQIVEGVDVLISRLESLHRNTPNYAFNGYQYETALKKIQKRVEEAIQKARA